MTAVSLVSAAGWKLTTVEASNPVATMRRAMAGRPASPAAPAAPVDVEPVGSTSTIEQVLPPGATLSAVSTSPTGPSNPIVKLPLIDWKTNPNLPVNPERHGRELRRRSYSPAMERRSRS